VTHLSTDVLVVGAGGAGMYAAIAAAREGSSVLLLDKNLIGRGGATIMAQMTVAAAIGHEEPDDWVLHLEDTLEAGRGICNEPLSAMVCQRGPERILEMDRWGTRWAREDGHIKQVGAPGHRRKRCCYVDFLSTGPAVAGTLRRQVSGMASVRRLSNVAVIEICVAAGHVRGAVALDLSTGSLRTIAERRTGLRWRLAPSWWTWSSCSSFRLRIWRLDWSVWTRSCGIRSATSLAANC
jgi:succinate dehydrogenase/fumarate reductase flavoprotein subunit